MCSIPIRLQQIWPDQRLPQNYPHKSKNTLRRFKIFLKEGEGKGKTNQEAPEAFFGESESPYRNMIKLRYKTLVDDSSAKQPVRN